MLKIGILTIHHVCNQGALLQAFSLLRALKKIRPHDRVEIIDLRIKQLEKNDFPKLNKALIHNIKTLVRKNNFLKNDLVLSKKKLVSDNYDKGIDFINQNNYDIIFVGSDEVWKISPGDKFSPSFPNVFWLSPKIKARKVAYAASANKTNFNEIIERDKIEMKKLLNGFDLIGVRDDNTFDFVKGLDNNLNNKLCFVPDPTFMYKLRDVGVKQKLEKAGLDFGRPIIELSMGHRELSRRIYQHFKNLDYQVVSFGIYNRYVDFNLGGILNPYEFAEAFRYVDFVITNRFHVTIFSIKNKTPFLSVIYDKRFKNTKSKIQSLLEKTEMPKNFINLNYSNDLNEIFPKIIEAKESFENKNIDEVLFKLEKESYDYLEKVFLCKQKSVC